MSLLQLDQCQLLPYPVTSAVPPAGNQPLVHKPGAMINVSHRNPLSKQKELTLMDLKAATFLTLNP